jgi:hypothetical protein
LATSERLAVDAPAAAARPTLAPVSKRRRDGAAVDAATPALNPARFLTIGWLTLSQRRRARELVLHEQRAVAVADDDRVVGVHLGTQVGLATRRRARELGDLRLDGLVRQVVGGDRKHPDVLACRP